MEIRRLTDQDAEVLWNFRLHALESEPEAFGESAEEHRQTPIDKYAERLRSSSKENFVLGAFNQSSLIGMLGFYRDLRLKRRHKGWIWGMFVARSYRGTGVGQALLQNAITKAKEIRGLHCVLLSVATTQDAARRLYLSAGFRPFGLEPRALRVADRYIDEEHMILEI